MIVSPETIIQPNYTGAVLLDAVRDVRQLEIKLEELNEFQEIETTAIDHLHDEAFEKYLPRPFILL